MSARNKFPLKHEGERFTTMYHSGSICAVRSELYSVTDQKRKKRKMFSKFNVVIIFQNAMFPKYSHFSQLWPKFLPFKGGQKIISGRAELRRGRDKLR